MSFRIFAAIAVALVANAIAVHGAQDRTGIKDLTMDLAALEPGKTGTISAPAGENIVVRVMNRLSGARYRFKVDFEGAAPGSMQHDFPSPTAIPKLVRDLPGCERLQERVDAVAAAQSESELLALLKAVDAESSSGRCQAHKSIRFAIDTQLLYPIPIGKIAPGERRKVRVERFDPASKETLAGWTIEIEGKGESPDWRYRTEGEWLVHSVAADMAEIAALALNYPAPEVEVRTENSRTYAVSIKPWGARELVGKVDFARRYALSPEAFKPLADMLLEVRSGKAKQEPSDNAILTALLEPKPEVLVKEDLRVSAALSHDPFSPGNHEQAALIISALALRGSTAVFSDLRYLLCRVCAHLAVARALRSEASDSSASGLWAEATLLTLAGRATEALAIADRTKSGSTGESWKRALTFRNTGDWRSFGKTDHVTLLELREAFRATAERRGGLAAMEMLENQEVPDTSDWSRLLLSRSYPVAVANSVAPEAVMEEVTEAGRVYKAYTGSALTPERWLSDLNGDGSRCVKTSEGKRTATVLGWANWAPFLRQHLLSALHAEVESLAKKLGLMEDARKTANNQDRQYARLKDYWRLLAVRANTESAGTANAPAPAGVDSKPMCRQAAASIAERPESVPLRAWAEAYNSCRAERNRGSIPPPERWFQPAMPAGTLYSLEQAWDSNFTRNIQTSELESMRDLAPWNFALTALLVPRKFGKSPTPAEAESILAPLLEYDSRAAQQVLSIAEDSGGDAGRYHERMCAMDADSCVEAGKWLSARGEDARALKAYERAFEKARNPLALANDADWPVDYYLDHGQPEDSLRFAKYAAEVYSHDGLRTMARLMERLGRYDEAVTWYQRIKERYGKASGMDEFYVRYRQRTGDDRFAEESAAAYQRVFPNGLEKAAFSDFREAPVSGDGLTIRVDQMSEKIRHAGLRPGDIVVAVDGYRVHNSEQWAAIRSFRDDPTISVVIWRGGGYIQLDGSYVRMKFGRPARPFI